jgi:alpha-galactosidase/6-phospho-beta-glucosidase family protein
MAPRVVIIGGGSVQWVPKLLVDVANTPSLHGSEMIIEDSNAASVSPMVDLAEHIARLRGIPLTATGTIDQRHALDGADFVVVAISTGGSPACATTSIFQGDTASTRPSETLSGLEASPERCGTYPC